MLWNKSYLNHVKFKTSATAYYCCANQHLSHVMVKPSKPSQFFTPSVKQQEPQNKETGKLDVSLSLKDKILNRSNINKLVIVCLFTFSTRHFFMKVTGLDLIQDCTNVACLIYGFISACCIVVIPLIIEHYNLYVIPSYAFIINLSNICFVYPYKWILNLISAFYTIHIISIYNYIVITIKKISISIVTNITSLFKIIVQVPLSISMRGKYYITIILKSVIKRYLSLKLSVNGSHSVINKPLTSKLMIVLGTILVILGFIVWVTVV